MTQQFNHLKNVMQREASKGDNLLGQARFGLVESYDPDKHRVICSFVPELTDDGDKILTNWLQIAELVGNAVRWGTVRPLELGTQVLMLPVYQSTAEFIVIGATYNDRDLVAQGPNDIGAADSNTQIGEYLIRSKTDFSMKFVDPNTLMIKGNYYKGQLLHIITQGTDIHHTTTDFITLDCKDCNVNASDNINLKASNVVNITAGSTINIKAPQINYTGEETINGNTQQNGNYQASGTVSDYGDSMGAMRAVFDVHIHDDTPPPTPLMPF